MLSDSGRILLVEDDRLYAQLIQNELGKFGHDLFWVSRLEEARSVVQRLYFDACLLDLGLPDSFGLPTFVSLNAAIPQLPVVILSGMDDTSLADQAVQLGAQDYLVKGPALFGSEAGASLLERAVRYAIERQVAYHLLREDRRLLEEQVTQTTRELRTLACRLVYAQEGERRRISRELHDEAGQALTALKLSLAMARDELPDTMAAARAQIDESIRQAESTMELLRRLAHDLRPPALDAVGLNQTLKDLCSRVQKSSSLQIQYRGCYMPELPEHIQVSLYRTLQEGLTNVIRHAQASQVFVQLKASENEISLLIRDDGVGLKFSPASGEPIPSGIGLLGIRERMLALGGRMELHSQPQAGTTLMVVIPLGEAA